MAISSEANTDQVVSLMKRSQEGDKAAFAELQAIGEANGRSYSEGWLSFLTSSRLQERAGGKNLLIRDAITKELESIARDLTDTRDGPIERIIIGRVAVCSVDAMLADHEHLWAIEHSPRTVEAVDRRRDRAHRRLLSTLKTLGEVRRANRVAIQVVVGDGNTVAMRA